MIVRERERTLDLAVAAEERESSAVAEGEAPPLQERGVAGLHLVESASFLRETAPSHLNVADLERGCLIPHRSGTTALGGDFSSD